MKRLLWLLVSGLFVFPAQAQSTYVPLNPDQYHLLDRLEIRQGEWAAGFHSTQKPYSRAGIVALIDTLLATPHYRFSPTDQFNLAYLRADNQEVLPPISDSVEIGALSRGFHGLGLLYRHPADAFAWHNRNFEGHISPVVGGTLGGQTADDTILTGVTMGLETRGSLVRRIGFYGFFTTNQVRYSRSLQDYAQRYELPAQGLAPGEGTARVRGQDQLAFYSWRGYLTTTLLKVISLQVGRDRLFLGNGYRSLLLSDNSAPYWLLKLTTHLGRVDYTNLYTLLQNTQVPLPGAGSNPTKFMVMHHLSINLGRHLNLGAFEAEVFSRDRFDLNYLNPVIFYRPVESSLGSVDNAFVGLDLKANLGGHWLVYSQFMLDEFVLKELRAGTGSWTNKFAIQVGAKYIDALGIANLDLQGELNLARPFTYSHKSGQTNYVHDNQPLAHPLGSNFIEGLGIVRYQQKRLQAVGTFSVMLFGTDPPGLNYGGNVLSDYRTRVRDEGNYIGQGRKTVVTYADLRLSYQVWHNGFVDARYLYRLQSSQYIPNSYSLQVGSIALRLNLAYRNWSF